MVAQTWAATHDYKRVRDALGALAADAAGDLDVLGLDCDPLGVDGLQVAVLKEMDSCRHEFDRNKYESNPDPWSAADVQSTLVEEANESDDDNSNKRDDSDDESDDGDSDGDSEGDSDGDSEGGWHLPHSKHR